MSAEKAKAIIERFDRLKADRATADATAQEIADYIAPRKSQINAKKTPGTLVSWTDNLFDMTATDANNVLAAGIVTNTTPTTSRWAAFEPSGQLRRERGTTVGAQWFEQITEIVMREISRSNFYTEIHEAHLERNIFPACCVFLEEGEQTTLIFRAIEYGTFVIAENHEGMVDTVMREFMLTARQAAQKFGVENLPEEVQKSLSDEGGIGKDKEFEFIHAVFPRGPEERDASKYDAENKPFASCYVCRLTNQLVQEGGYDEMPYAVSRFLKWPGSVWGYTPAIDCLPTVKQLNGIEESMDVLAEKAANPPILLPSYFAGQPDSRAGAGTFFDENQPNALPREWQTSGRYDIGKDRVEVKRDFVRKAFFYELFQMFSGVEREMTAYEVSQRVAEKLDLFSPTFQRITTELLSPLLLRCLGICYRKGVLPEAPAEVMVDTDRGSFPPLPEVVYSSKLALAIRALENRSFIEFMNVIAGLAPFKPDVVDWIEDSEAVPGIARNMAVASSWIRTPEKVELIRTQRMQAQQQEQAMMMLQQTAKAGADMSKMPEELKRKTMKAMEETE